MKEKKRWKDLPAMQQLRHQPYITAILIVVNLLVFFILSIQGSTLDGDFMYQSGAMYAPDVLKEGQWWQVFTSMFMHFGMEHLIRNMVILLILGNQIEDAFGRGKYLICYLIAGVAGSILSGVWDLYTGEYAISAGASGAIMGLFGILLVMIFKSTTQRKRISGIRLIALFLLIAFGDMTEGVDWMAHFGGALAGVILGFLLYRPDGKFSAEKFQ